VFCRHANFAASKIWRVDRNLIHMTLQAGPIQACERQLREDGDAPLNAKPSARSGEVSSAVVPKPYPSVSRTCDEAGYFANSD
jgi:hypothetical protein